LGTKLNSNIDEVLQHGYKNYDGLMLFVNSRSFVGKFEVEWETDKLIYRFE
jgi:hypothetical protein